MKVYYVSDVHLNHHALFNHNLIKWEKETRTFVNNHFVSDDSKESTIVIAGDYSEWNIQSKWLFEELSLHYKYVIGVFGNHDLYILSKNQLKKYNRNSMNRAKELIEMTADIENVYLLQNEVITLDGVTIAGSRLWYNLTTPESKAFFKEMSNDSNYIYPNTSNFYEEYNKEDLLFYDSLEHVDLLVTHVPPIHPKSSPYSYNECYTTKVDELKATHWIAGHQHLKTTETFFDTTIYMNSLGYPSENTSKSFTLMSFEI